MGFGSTTEVSEPFAARRAPARPIRSPLPAGARYRGPVLHRLDLRGVDDPVASLPRPDVLAERPVEAVRGIIAEVRTRGDAALLDLTERFDGVRPESLRVSPDSIAAALRATRPEVLAALDHARDRIVEHHRRQLRAEVVHDESGVVVRSYSSPVDSAGCYVPGGRASYPSTLLMTAIPAKVAGVGRVVVCVPPDRSTGMPPEVTLAAAAVAEVDEVYAVGGAQAVAAMAYGTESMAPVDVICGPGNLYVAVAKQEVAGTVGIAAAFAGPSEMVVVADRSVPAELAALDVMLQAEHGPDGLAWLVTWEEDTADAVCAAVERLTAESPRREEISATLERSGYCVLVDSPEEAIAVSDAVAPEHLELLCSDPEALVPLVRHAGAIFCGPWSPASIGDYLAGPSHVLPTHGSARFASALTVDDFCRHHHVITADPDGLRAVGPDTAVLAEAEGLPTHAESVRARLALLEDAAQQRGADSTDGTVEAAEGSR
jgi:histidinol dehydrogenase